MDTMTCHLDDIAIVAAIDLGTTYSGIAFSTRDDFKRNPSQVFVRTWTSGVSNIETYKTSSCILFDENKKFDKFGFEAEEKYTELLTEDESEKGYFFRRFKMFLYNTERISDDMMIRSENGKFLPALQVFSAAIWFLKNEMMMDCQRQLTNIQETDIKWVITVPAIWTQPAKSFVRYAAIKAGINTDRLELALEPEAAAILLKNLPMEKRASSNPGDIFTTFLPGSKYLVIDAGGGTIDVTAHEIMEDGKVRELLQASGGDWGGINVDKDFFSFVEKLVGKDVMESFKDKHKSELFDFQLNVESAKYRFKPNNDKFTISIPTELFQIHSELHPGSDLKSETKYSLNHGEIETFSWTKNKIRFNYKIARSFFEDSISSIIGHLKSVLGDELGSGINTILMVGGYSDSLILSQAVQTCFPNKRILVPKQASRSVLEGAVIFGHDASLIKQRRSKFTYGIKCKKPFIEGTHDESKKVEENNRVMCTELFSKHVEIGELITVGEYQTNKRYRASKKGKSTLEVYASNDKNPVYTTDKGCFKIGEIQIENDGVEVGSRTRVMMSFSQTEIQVKMNHKITGESTCLCLEFDSLSK